MTANDITFNPDLLKPLSEVLNPDPRSSYFVNIHTGQPETLAEHHAYVSQYTLTETVPDEVTILFETAKNLWVYAWFAYRFYPVAEHQAITALEMGLRERITPSMLKGRRTLGPLLRYAADHGLIRDELFTARNWLIQKLARQRYLVEHTLEMQKLGLTESAIDYSKAVPNDKERAIEYVEYLIEFLRTHRNSYAHGSRTLHNNPAEAFLAVTEILNQVYPPTS